MRYINSFNKGESIVLGSILSAAVRGNKQVRNNISASTLTEMRLLLTVKLTLFQFLLTDFRKFKWGNDIKMLFVKINLKQQMTYAAY